MPTSVQGLPLHTRALSVMMSPEADGRWLARGDVMDLRKNGFVAATYDLQPAGVIHSMSIELDLDPRALVIEAIRVEQPFVAVEASPETSGECCRDPAPRLQTLVGEKLDAEFTRRLTAAFGGPLGCSHLLTLFQLMASTIPRAARLEHARAEREGTHPQTRERFFRRSLFLDGYARRDEPLIDVSIQLADSHTRPIDAKDPVLQRLASSHQIKVLAEVDRKRFSVQALTARERERTPETLGHAEWLDHDALVSPLVGVPLIPGMAGRVFELLGQRSEQALLRDVLLQMAPGFIQVTAALTDDYYEERARKGADETDSGPAVANLGGRQNACYIWREDGAILRSWARRAEQRSTS
ncbi:MAG: DUF2889 domain-containing protein [Deltaproteobacteria bacterium]|nr:DUF2889 domain-containing protein [Deltaproteobacteria bacterium]